MLVRCCLHVADIPRKPDKPWVSDGADGVLTVRWKTPYDGGSPILQYVLLARYVPSCVFAGRVLKTAEYKCITFMIAVTLHNI